MGDSRLRAKASHAGFMIWESKIDEMNAVFPAKTTQAFDENIAVYVYTYVPTYVPIYVPAHIATSLPTPTYHPRNLPRTKELPEGALARECKGLINPTRH